MVRLVVIMVMYWRRCIGGVYDGVVLAPGVGPVATNGAASSTWYGEVALGTKELTQHAEPIGEGS